MSSNVIEFLSGFFLTGTFDFFFFFCCFCFQPFYLIRVKQFYLFMVYFSENRNTSTDKQLFDGVCSRCLFATSVPKKAFIDVVNTVS